MRVFAAALALLLALGVLPVDAGPPVFRRGAGLHTMMNWAQTAPGPQNYADDPFAAPEYDVPDALLANIADAGFDFIRLSVDPGPFLALEGTPRDRLDALLVNNVRRIAGFGLGVIVDFHPNAQVGAYSPPVFVEEGNDAFFDRYAALITRTARLLAGLKIDRLAIELLNEPQTGYTDKQIARWGQMQQRLHRAVRSEAPEMTVIVTGGRGGSAKGLAELDPAPFNDTHTLFSFHYYEPHAFTHQGLESREPSIRHLRYFSNLPYPPDTGAPDAVWEGIKLAIEADASLSAYQRRGMRIAARQALNAYFAGGYGRARIEKDFDAVSAWAREHGIDTDRIFLGEFGVVRSYGRFAGADAISRAAWLADVRQAAEAHGFAWSYWSVRSYGGMVLVEADGSTDLHAPTLRALGMAP